VVVHLEEAPQAPGSPLSPRSPAWGHMANTHWLLTTAVMLSDMLGLGTLSLPAGTQPLDLSA